MLDGLVLDGMKGGINCVGWFECSWKCVMVCELMRACIMHVGTCRELMRSWDV